MRLFFDIGNSRCKYVTESKGQLSAIEYQTVAEVDQSWLVSAFSKVTACLVADVANSPAREVIIQWCKVHSIPVELMRSEREKFTIKCAYDNPTSFGVDRWLTLLAAQQLFPQQHSLIIDSGTATTIDYLADNGQHQGGWILAGIDTLFTSLLANTSNVHAKPSLVDQPTFANNTSDGVNQAAWAATTGMVEQARLHVMKHFHVAERNIRIIFTGGNGKELQRHFQRPSHLVDKLLFIGMQSYK